MKRINLVVASILVLVMLLSGCNLNTDTTSTPTPIGDGNSGVPADTSAWVRPGPADPQAPLLLEKSNRVDNSELRIKPDWEVASIEYGSFEGRLGDPSPANQFIQRDGAGYKLGASSVAPEDVQALIRSLDHLYPAQMLMERHAWTDDYPSWTIKIRGTDGQLVLLLASSTGNPGNGPWNMVYNGRLYAQYDGSVARSLGQLFGGRLSKGDRPFDDSSPADQVKFSTTGLPPQWTSATTAGHPYILLPPSPEIETALLAHPAARDLLSDHILGSSRYSASLRAEEPLQGTRTGEVILFGQTLVDSKTVRYTIGGQFAIQDGKLTYWDLDRAGLNAMLKSITTQQLTRRVLAADGQAVINMWYANGQAPMERGYSDNPPQESYGAQVNACGAVPGGSFPTSGKPLLAFGFNVSPYFYTAPFVLIDGQAVVNELTLHPGEPDPIQKVLLPQTLDIGTSKPSASIYMESAPTFGGPPTLHIEVPRQADQAERAIYQERLKALAVESEVNQGDIKEGEIEARGVTLAFDQDGKLQVVSCAASPATGGTTGLDQGGKPPRLVYSTYFGSTKDSSGGSTEAEALVVDGAGNAYVAGSTSAGDLPLKNLYKSAPQGNFWNAFVAELDPNGSSLLSGSYIGFSDETQAYDVALDTQGNIYITGSALEGFGAQNSPIQCEFKGRTDAYVVKLAPTGALIYATCLGGTDHDEGFRIAVDKQGYAYVVGSTSSGDFRTERPLQPEYGGKGEKGWDGDVFIAKIAPDGSHLVYSTYLGGKGADKAYGITVDAAGNAYVVGSTLSEDFPLVHPLKSVLGKNGDGFVAKISPDGQSLIYATYFGSDGGIVANVAINSDGEAYLVGSTASASFPLVRPLFSNFNGGVAFSKSEDSVRDAFVAKLSADGSAILFSTYLGGSAGDKGYGIGLDAQGNIYVGGSTASRDFPTVRPLQKEYSDKGMGISTDSFIAKLAPDASRLLYSTYFGVDGFDSANDFAVDSLGNVYLTGVIDEWSPGFPLAGKPFQSTNNGMRNAFIAKISDDQP
jgi:hypothetical protein